MNRYEKQLYSVFKSFDVDNEEALDKSAVGELCDALQLEDRGAALIRTLFERRTDRVTFSQFRNGLLAVLGGAGGELTPVSAAASATPLPPEPPSDSVPPSHHSDDDSSGREVAPKFVFGSKKYGRRSRPHVNARTESPSPRSLSASRLDSNNKTERQQLRCRRSASAMENRIEAEAQNVGDKILAPDPVEHDRRIDRNQALELCRDLHMDGIDQRLVERIFEDTGTTETTVGEFFDRLNASLTTTMEETNREVRAPTTSTDTSNDTSDDEAIGVPSELVLEAWESAGVQQPRRLLIELGFTATALRPIDIERALDDELRAMPDPPSESRNARCILLAAALALSRLRLELAQRRAELTIAERDKLRCDVSEANRRAQLLAQEVDDSQARIEAELKATVRRAEARQAEVARQIAAEQAAERERAAVTRNHLEAEVARRSDVEARLRGELNTLRKRIDQLESLASTAEERAIENERERARLAVELRTALDHNAATVAQCGESAELAARLHELHSANKQLRDRNDELCAALEATARMAAPYPSSTARGGDLSTELNSLLMQDSPEECDSAPVSIDQRILGHIEAITKLRQICESINTIKFTETKDCGSCTTVGESIRQLQERVRDLSDTLPLSESSRAHVASQTEGIDDTVALDRELLEQKAKHEDEKQKLTSLIKDMEMSLEQMKIEYDKCEEYWSNKLEEERDAYTEEQRLGDERLAELIAKIGDYERQFTATPAALPTIDERCSLEMQFTDLEEEFASYRREKEAELQASAAECARLIERADVLERRVATIETERAASPCQRRRPRDYHNPAFGPPRPSDASETQHEPTRLLEAGTRQTAEIRELRARCARAETAVRRLHARLAAADLLVKDLYVENCQLAHRRPL